MFDTGCTQCSHSVTAGYHRHGHRLMMLTQTQKFTSQCAYTLKGHKMVFRDETKEDKTEIRRVAESVD